VNRFNDSNNQDLQSKYKVNDGIKSDSVMVIGVNGENLGTVSRRQALALAEQENMDLVQVGEKDSVAIARIMNFGKFIYEKKKQLSEAKKHQKLVQIKEIKLRPSIDEQDYKTKLNKAVECFRDGNKVKFTLQFKGREVPKMDEFGAKLFARISQDLAAKNVGTLQEEKDSRGGILWSKVYFVKEK
jgi:translation initiation factor IF-3